MVRCKFMLTEITECNWSKTAKRLKFSAVYDQSIPEDQRFYKATPSAEFTMLVDNPLALAMFKLGEQYYFDASPVSGPPTA